ncbi:MAG: hypothetical protein ACE5JR_00310 [Gemmatimonadota bacterium]
MEELLWLALTGGASAFGYFKTRAFVRERLRFVDVAHRGAAPVIAGALAALVASPLALLPVINGASALLFGVGVGLGARKGTRDVKRITGS